MLNSNVRDAINFLVNPPLFVGYASGTQSIPNAANTTLTFDTNITDTYNGHSTITNPSRYTAQLAGWYQLFAQVAWASNATGYRIGVFNKNGANTGVEAYTPPVSGNVTIMQVTHPGIQMNVGDYVEVAVYQTSGGALGTLNPNCYLSARWMHA
jgi:hypothetical protein